MAVAATSASAWRASSTGTPKPAARSVGSGSSAAAKAGSSRTRIGAMARVRPTISMCVGASIRVLSSLLSMGAYPIVRIVPTRLIDVDTAHCGRRRVECLIYFGLPIHAETDGGVQGVTLRLLEMEATIVARFRPEPGWKVKYLETITDEDRIAAYKLMAVRCEVEG